MAKSKKVNKKSIEQYDHKDKQRVNNPPVGLVDAEKDPDTGKKTYQYDPHLDPQLQWAGKAEHLSFEVDTVSLHVHERIDPRSIIEAVRKKNGQNYIQGSLFASKEENPPLREAIEFYKHKHNWSNRLIAGDSLLVMNSLLEKEGMGGQTQMIYMDPPYGIKYGSNFQPFVNKRDVKDGKDEDLTAEPETIKAFRDTWELGIHSYLTYLRDRFLLARELLNESGSIFVQISDENVHHVRELLDEIFDTKNFISLITFRKKTGPLGSAYLPQISDYILWYAKDIKIVKYRKCYENRNVEGDQIWSFVELPDGRRRKLNFEELNRHALLPKGARVFRKRSLSPAGFNASATFDVIFEGRKYFPPRRSGGASWTTSQQGMERLIKAKRIIPTGNTLDFVYYLDDFPYTEINNVWSQTRGETDKIYAVQTDTLVVQRCLLMTTDPGDLVLDPTCGSGTTAYVAEQWGRRWITCDTSRVAITLAKQRLMTALFDYYELAHPNEGVGSGFKYKTVPHITLKSIANNEPPGQETLYDQPFVDNSRTRVTGPFTVEAVPSPLVKSPSEIEAPPSADDSVTRSGETLRQSEWKDELLKTGIRGKGGQRIEFTRVETLPGTRWIHCDAETKEKEPRRAVIAFGPEHSPMEKRQVQMAIQEAQKLVPYPKIVVFAAFQFDPETAKDIDETDWPGVTLLKAQMNADLLTEDLKKKRASNDSFWLIGQPDVELRRITNGKDKGKPALSKAEMYEVEVNGFDYYNTISGVVESGGTEKIAMWMLDTDYDGRSLFPRQVFFPMAGEGEGWSRLARNLKAEIDEELIEAYRGTKSLPFEVGDYKRVAVKIIDDRGIESLKIIEIE
ncbi:MAG: hypothetical protein Kow0090_16720 [Myxococcota bacterium]